MLRARDGRRGGHALRDAALDHPREVTARGLLDPFEIVRHRRDRLDEITGLAPVHARCLDLVEVSPPLEMFGRVVARVVAVAPEEREIGARLEALAHEHEPALVSDLAPVVRLSK